MAAAIQKKELLKATGRRCYRRALGQNGIPRKLDRTR
jgi:hypothetical protein